MTLRFSSRSPIRADESIAPGSALFLTAGTYQKRSFIVGDARKNMLLESLDFNAFKWHWRIAAYVILDNHYHLVLIPPAGDGSRLAHIIQSAHSYAAYHWRKDDPGIRTRIWWNFWDAPIGNEELLRRHVNYLHENPRRHGLSSDPATYRFSSYGEYLRLDASTIHRWEVDHPAADLSIIDNF